MKLVEKIKNLIEIYGVKENEIEWVGIRELVTTGWPEFKTNFSDLELSEEKHMNPCFAVKAGTWFIEPNEEGELKFRSLPKPGIVEGQILTESLLLGEHERE